MFHAEQQANIVVEAKAPFQKLMDWAKEKRWKNVHLLSSFKNTYNDGRGKKYLHCFRELSQQRNCFMVSLLQGEVCRGQATHIQYIFISPMVQQ